VYTHDVTGTLKLDLPPLSVMWPALAEFPQMLRPPDGD